MAGILRRPAVPFRSGQGALPDVAPARAGRRATGGDPGTDFYRLRQHHPDRVGALVPRGRGGRAPLPTMDQVERRDHGAPSAASGCRGRRAHLDIRFLGLALRSRLQPLLPGQVTPRWWRPDLHSGPRLTGHLRPCVPGRPIVGGSDGRFPPGAQPSGRRVAVLPAPPADARLLGVPHGVDGAGTDERDLSGPVQSLPPRSRYQGHLRSACLGVPRRRRDRRTGEPRTGPCRRAGGTGQPDLRRQLQPAATRRAGARQRKDRAGIGIILPGRGMERHQGGVGPRMGRTVASR